MTNLTKESLGVFWFFEGSHSHEEVAGILAYGYFGQESKGTILFPYKLWPEDTLAKSYTYMGDDWHIVEWTIRLTQWPKVSAWEKVLNETLSIFTQNGAKVAWCGLEGYFATPPSLFSPEEMSGGIYAILTPDGQFMCPAHLDKPFQTLSDEELIKVRSLIE